MLRRRDLGQPRLLAARLHAQERDQSTNLLLHRLEPGQGFELREQILERPCRLLAPQHLDVELVADLGAQLLAERLQPFERVRGHARKLQAVRYT